MQKIAVFSGAFDPIHNGHLKIANQVLDYVDTVALIAEPKSYSKQNTTELAVRESMIDIAISKRRNLIRVKNIDLEGPHNTNNILTSLSNSGLSDCQVSFIFGEDVFKDIRNWRDFESIKDYPFFVVERNNHELNKIFADSDLQITFIRGDHSEASTLVRENRDFRIIDSGVRDYILDNGLY